MATTLCVKVLPFSRKVHLAIWGWSRRILLLWHHLLKSSLFSYLHWRHWRGNSDVLLSTRREVISCKNTSAKERSRFRHSHIPFHLSHTQLIIPLFLHLSTVPGIWHAAYSRWSTSQGSDDFARRVCAGRYGTIHGHSLLLPYDPQPLSRSRIDWSYQLGVFFSLPISIYSSNWKMTPAHLSLLACQMNDTRY